MISINVPFSKKDLIVVISLMISSSQFGSCSFLDYIWQSPSKMHDELTQGSTVKGQDLNSAKGHQDVKPIQTNPNNAQIAPNPQPPPNTPNAPNPQPPPMAQSPQYPPIVPNPQFPLIAPNPQYPAMIPNPQYSQIAPNPQFPPIAPNPQYPAMMPNPQYSPIAPNPQLSPIAPNPQLPPFAPNPQTSQVAPNPQPPPIAPSPQSPPMAPKPQSPPIAPNPQPPQIIVQTPPESKPGFFSRALNTFSDLFRIWWDMHQDYKIQELQNRANHIENHLQHHSSGSGHRSYITHAKSKHTAHSGRSSVNIKILKPYSQAKTSRMKNALIAGVKKVFGFIAKSLKSRGRWKGTRRFAKVV